MTPARSRAKYDSVDVHPEPSTALSPRHLFALRTATDGDPHGGRLSHDLRLPLELSEALDEATGDRTGNLIVARQREALLEAEALRDPLA